MSARFVPASLTLFKQAQQIVSVVISDEFIGPIGEGFAADADALQVLERGVEQWLDIATEHLRLHHKRVAARKEDAAYFFVLAHIFDELVGLLGREFELVDADELGPSEAIGAIGVARLAGGGEKEHRLPVFMLHAVKRLMVHFRDVQLHLSGWMSGFSVC